MSDRTGPQTTSGSPHFAVLDASPDAIVGVGERGLIIYANAPAEAIFGYRSDELIGRPVEFLLPKGLARRHVGQRNAFLADPHPRPMGIGLELAGRRRDGSEFPVEVSLSPVSIDGRAEVFATVVDISARKAAERGLAESERRFRAVLDASPNAMIGVDHDGRIIYVNAQAEATFGYPPDELIGTPVEVLVPQGVRKGHVHHRDDSLPIARARPMGSGREVAGRRKDGSVFPAEISLTPVSTDRGPEVFATVVDITTRKAAEAELLQTQKLESIGRLAGGIAHDFNNMMFAIRGFADMLTEDLAEDHRAEFDPDAALGSVNMITVAAERASALTAQLLAFSRRQVVSPRPLDLNASVRDIAPMLRRLIGEDIVLKLRLRPDVGALLADPGQVDQILVNLVVNARDAMPAGGSVTIATQQVAFDEPFAMEHLEVVPGSYVQLTVSDTGVGMDRKTREHIFEPFFTTKEVGKGAGLGLAIIYGIVRQSGGHVWLYSEPGHGTTFKLYFPRHAAESEVPRPPLPTPLERREGTVMLVEDEETVREMTTRLLERAGYTVVALADGAAALTHVAKGRSDIDVLVTDVVMPGISGLRLGELMLDHYPSMGLVLLSGYMAESLDLSALSARGARFVSKPVASQEFLAAVDEAMTERPRRPVG